MADDAGIGVFLGEGLKKRPEGGLLSWRPGVGRLTSFIHTTFIHNPEGAVVVVAGMNALDGLGQQRNDIAIAADIIVVRTLTILGIAAGNEVLDTEGLVALVGHAVDHEELNGFQRFHNFVVKG